MRKLIDVHYHSTYLYDLALVSAKAGQGIGSVIASVTAVESLLGDIRLTYATRRDVVAEMTLPEKKFSLFGSTEVASSSVEHYRLTEQELAVLHILEPQLNEKGKPIGKKPPLNLYYQLMGCKENENRHEDEYTKLNQRELHPSYIVDLFDLRHSIVHRDGGPRVESDLDSLRQRGIPNSVAFLEPLGLIAEADFKEGRGWLSAIDTKEVGMWSVSSAGLFIKLVLDSLPEGLASDYLRENALP